MADKNVQMYVGALHKKPIILGPGLSLRVTTSLSLTLLLLINSKRNR